MGVEDTVAFIVPRSQHMNAINYLHRDAGHQGRERTQSLARERLWWPGMDEQIVSALSSCKRCQIHEGKSSKAKLVNLMATCPMEMVHVDFTSIEEGEDRQGNPKTTNVLVLQDHFTKYVQVYVMPDRKSSTVAKCLYKFYFQAFGAPEKLVSDQAKEFCSDLIKSFYELFGTQ